MSKENYFTERDARNIATIEKIIAEDLPDFTEEYFVGISSRTTTLTRLNYAYDLRTFFQYISRKIPRFKTKSTCS